MNPLTTILIYIATLSCAVLSLDAQDVKTPDTRVLCYRVTVDWKRPPWEIGCDTMLTQTDMNLCSMEALSIAEGMMNSLYSELIVVSESEDLYDSVRTQKFTTWLKKSMDDFEIFKHSSLTVVSHLKEGASMRPLVVNKLALEMTIDQIKVLMIMRDELNGP